MESILNTLSSDDEYSMCIEILSVLEVPSGTTESLHTNGDCATICPMTGM